MKCQFSISSHPQRTAETAGSGSSLRVRTRRSGGRTFAAGAVDVRSLYGPELRIGYAKFYRLGCSVKCTPPEGDLLHEHKAQCKRRLDPRPREGGDPRARGRGGRLDVSIHAPARGATEQLSTSRRPVNVSIHAPARGATFRYRRSPRAGAVSIHAPARGATHG